MRTSSDPLQQDRLALVDGGHGLLASDVRELLKEAVEGITGGQVLEERADRNTGSREDGLAAQDVFVAGHDLGTAHFDLPILARPWSAVAAAPTVRPGYDDRQIGRILRVSEEDEWLAEWKKVCGGN